VTDDFSPVRSYSTHIQAGMTNDDDDLSSFSASTRLRTGDRSLSRPFRVI